MKNYYSMTDVDQRLFKGFTWTVTRRQGDDTYKTETRIGKVSETRGHAFLESYSIFIKTSDNTWQYYAPSDYLSRIEGVIKFPEVGE